MYEFKPYVTEKALNNNASRFDVTKTGLNSWKITMIDYFHEYTLQLNDGVYCLSCFDSHDSWKCFFVVVDDSVTIETAIRNGTKLKAESRLKAFSQIVMSMWGLMQCGKIV